MNRVQIEVENIKCGGCANGIKHRLKEMLEVSDVDICNDTQVVTIDYEGNESTEENFAKALTKMGYPPKGENNTYLKAKSFVSCAIGRMSE